MLVHIEGFDDGLQSSKWTSYSVQARGASTGRNGSGVSLSSTSQEMTKALGAGEDATVTVGFALRATPHATNTVGLVQLRSDSGVTTHLLLALTPAGMLAVCRGSVSTVLGTSSSGITSGTWYYVELKATLHDTAGAAEVRVNGVTVLNLTGIDTKNAGTKTVFDTVAFKSTMLFTSEYDDVYICNADNTDTAGNTGFLGDCIITTLYPNGAGTVNGLTGSDGNNVDNHLLVDEPDTPNTTDYVIHAAVGDLEEYTFADMPTAAAVKGVFLRAYAATSDAGTAKLKGYARVAGVIATLDSGELRALSSTYTGVEWRAPLVPSDSTTWTPSKINSAEFGVQHEIA